MARLRPNPLLDLTALELLLTPLEVLLVGIPLSRLFPGAGGAVALIPWAGGLLAGWMVLTLLWLRPLLGERAAAEGQALYNRARALPARVLLIRLAAGGVLAVVLLERLSRGGSPGLDTVLALLSICLLHPLGVGLARYALWHRVLRHCLEGGDLLPPPLTLQADTLTGRLGEVVLLLGVAAAVLLVLMANLYITLTDGQLLALEAYLSWPLLLLGGAWYLLVLPRMIAPLAKYLRRASRGEEPALEQLLATMSRAQRLPFLLALTRLATAVTAGLILLIIAGPLLGLRPGQAWVLASALAALAVGTGVYDMIWSRVELRPVVSHLVSRPGAQERATRATPIRIKMMLNLGGVVIFTVALALFWTVLPQQHPVGLAVLVAMVLAVSLGAVHLTAADVTRPLASLERRAAEVVRGSLDREVRHDGEYDTSARISSAFEKMRQDLLRKLRTIEQLNEELEDKVRRRTAELEHANGELVGAIEALKETQAQLVRSEKMATVGQLVAGIAHEINNPINAVINSVAPLAETVEELAAGGDEAAEARQDALDMVRVIRSGVERTQRIVQALKNYARTDGEIPTPVDLEADLDESLALLAHLLKEVTVEREFSHSGRPTALRGQLNQALMNLLSNAAQAAEGQPDARITVRTRDLPQGGVEIQVQDNGPGIPGDALPKIFDPFFTTKEVGAGTGLGLSITHGIVERHGGEITVESEPGRTLFTLQIPDRPPEQA